ncbi:TPA: hypothetical protein ACK3Q6_004165 [Burkholderia cepacia]|uniref:hypothetical protein n=1 Tax=Burkholderia cepacia TaxID=292 RepID=UPI00075B30A2|nr:hypothetical protein [Burkholderia cepacia]MCA8361163.1 hypothetical protein [Burkholderia cepacia]HDR9758851.1 hypothetical protein [Burkholderia cepacia ATCC 25416]HDV6365680.1 hypothetical protein [Burkholderia cepacia]
MPIPVRRFLEVTIARLFAAQLVSIVAFLMLAQNRAAEYLVLCATCFVGAFIVGRLTRIYGRSGYDRLPYYPRWLSMQAVILNLGLSLIALAAGRSGWICAVTLPCMLGLVCSDYLYLRLQNRPKR